MEIPCTDVDELGDAKPGCVQQLDHRAIAEAARRRHVGLRDQRVHLVDRQECGQRRPGARRLQIVGRIPLEPLLDDEEFVEAADGRDAPRDRSRRESAVHLLAHERFERSPIERIQSALATGGELSQRGQIARVTLERVRGQTPFNAKMIQVIVDHRRLSL